VFAGAILVTILALVLEGVFAAVQRLTVPKGVRILRGSPTALGAGRAARVAPDAAPVDGSDTDPVPSPSPHTQHHPTQ
jgi:osmoprotectant transport system permease protein